MTVKRWHAICAAGLSVLTLAACAPNSDGAGKPVTLVEVTTAELVPHATRQVLAGTVEARAETPAAFLISGRLDRLDFAVGDRVKKGEVLATVSRVEQQADVDAAQAGVTAARLRVEQVKSSLDRQKSLWDQGLTTRSALDAAQTSWETATGDLERANAQLDLAQEALGYTSLLAPADGVVINKLAEADEVVQAGSPVYVIAEDGPRNVVINVQETAVAAWRDAMAITVTPAAGQGTSTAGTISEIAPALDNTGTVPVKIAIDSDFPLGAAVRVELTQAPSDRVVLPAQALGQEHGKPTVWLVAEDSSVRQAPVVVDSYETGTVVIAGGLATGDVVVVAGGQFLSPGQKVETREGATK